MKYRAIYSNNAGVINSGWDQPRRILVLARQWEEDGQRVTIEDERDGSWIVEDFAEFVESGDADQ